LLTSRLAKPGGVLERPADTPGRTDYQDGAVGVADNGVGDVTHEGTSHPAEPAAADHYHAGVDVLGKVYYRLIPLFIHLQVGDRHGAAGLFYLPDLFVEYLLGLFLEIVAARLGIFVVDRGRKRAPDRNDVQPRVCALGEIYRYLGRQFRVRRTVGSQ
jgi:hypothetical protein